MEVKGEEQSVPDTFVRREVFYLHFDVQSIIQHRVNRLFQALYRVRVK